MGIDMLCHTRDLQERYMLVVLPCSFGYFQPAGMPAQLYFRRLLGVRYVLMHHDGSECMARMCCILVELHLHIPEDVCRRLAAFFVVISSPRPPRPSLPPRAVQPNTSLAAWCKGVSHWHVLLHLLVDHVSLSLLEVPNRRRTRPAARL